MSTTEIENQIKATAIHNGPLVNPRGFVYLFKAKSGTLHAVADTEQDPDTHPKRYERMWNPCQGRDFDTRTTQGWGWTDKAEMSALVEAGTITVCATCYTRVMKDGRVS